MIADKQAHESCIVILRGQSARAVKPQEQRELPPGVKGWLHNVIVPELVREFLAERLGVAEKRADVANSHPMTEDEQQ